MTALPVLLDLPITQRTMRSIGIGHVREVRVHIEECIGSEHADWDTSLAERVLAASTRMPLRVDHPAEVAMPVFGKR